MLLAYSLPLFKCCKKEVQEESWQKKVASCQVKFGDKFPSPVFQPTVLVQNSVVPKALLQQFLLRHQWDATGEQEMAPTLGDQGCMHSVWGKPKNPMVWGKPKPWVLPSVWGKPKNPEVHKFPEEDPWQPPDLLRPV